MSSSSSTEALDAIQKRELENKSAGWDDYGGNPLAHIHSVDSARLPALGTALQLGLYRPPNKTQANPALLGLADFALTTFGLSLINIGVRGVTSPNIVVGPAFAYGGLVQLLEGMWKVAMGNTVSAEIVVDKL
ncbi:Hypothetical protein R9X50_00137500 [Acrodontium crateriforme]|uniref:Uncharacterized protein n=1 Tax=Acrodontium crateriforme TaxID=150365 RepID=A0AAQ3M1Y1_9PEZI|nr:Hypothetical protein R9X50_00137500 [Acrodontium crateriforme]